MDSALLLTIEDGAPVLPETVLWALNLQEGDLLTVERSEDPRVLELQSYLCRLESLLDLCFEPWPYIEPVLRKSMAAVGPKGRLLLPAEAKDLSMPQEGSLVLRQLVVPTGLFTLQTPD